MRRVLMTFLLVFALAAVGLAQTTEQNYTVQQGDTLWWLEGYHRGDPSQWRRIVDANPFLKETGRIYEKGGKTIALIRPGEQLQALVGLGILPQAVPLSELQASATSAFYYSSWFGALVVLLMLAVAYVFLRRLFSDPATWDDPVVENGIRPERARDVEDLFQRFARMRYGERNPADSGSMPTRIGPVEEGLLSGLGRVRYRGDHTSWKYLRNEQAYKARFRFPDGQEEDLYFLQRCANDVMTGTRYLGFNFTRRAFVGPSPEEMQRVVHGAPLRVAASRSESPLTTVTIAGLRIVMPEGSSVGIGENGEISLTVARACDITIGRVKKAKAKAAKPVVPAATAS